MTFVKFFLTFYVGIWTGIVLLGIFAGRPRDDAAEWEGRE